MVKLGLSTYLPVLSCSLNHCDSIPFNWRLAQQNYRQSSLSSPFLQYANLARQLVVRGTSGLHRGDVRDSQMDGTPLQGHLRRLVRLREEHARSEVNKVPQWIEVRYWSLHLSAAILNTLNSQGCPGGIRRIAKTLSQIIIIIIIKLYFRPTWPIKWIQTYVKIHNVHRGYATGKTYNTDRQCFRNWELKNVELETVFTTLFRELSTRCLKPEILFRHNSLKLGMPLDTNMLLALQCRG